MTRAVAKKERLMKAAKCLVTISIFFVSTLAMAQEFRMDAAADGKADSGYQTKWDSNHNRLLLYRDVSSADIPAARIFRPDGSSLPIYLLRDFQDAKFADIWAASATPQGGMVLSIILGFGARPDPGDQSKPFPALRSLLLTYDSNGALKKVWNVAPYQHQALAVDSEGNVFALGTRDAGPEGFPSIIKYSSSGKVLGEYAPSTLFAGGGSALDGDGLNGSPELLIRKQQLVLWVSSLREVFRFSLNGELQKRAPLGRILDGLARQNGYERATVISLAVSDSGDLTTQIRLWPKSTSAKGIMIGMATLPNEAPQAKLLGPLIPITQTQRFLGLGEDSRPVFLEHAEKGQIVVRKH
jgi:hypothetical protein